MNKLALSLLIFLWGSSLFSQNLNQDWATTISNEVGGSYTEFNLAIPETDGTIVAGKSSSPLGYDMYLAKYGQAGQLEWERFIDTPNNSEITHVESDSDGNYYIVGFEIQFAFFSRRIHLAKVNSEGEVQWHTSYEGPQGIRGWANDLVLSENALHICGIEDQPDGFDSGFVAQFTLEGELEWDHDLYPGLGNDLTALTVTPNGNVTAVGYADADYSLYAIQYDSEGNTNWVFPDVLEGENEIKFTDIVSDSDGNLYTQITEETGFFEFSIITQKRANDFTLIWEEEFNNGEVNEGKTLELGSDGSVYSFLEEETGSDYYARVIKYSNSGEELFSLNDEIGNGTHFDKGVIDENDQIFLGMESIDFYGVSTYTSSGTYIQSTVYDQSEIDFLIDIAAGNGVVVGVGRTSLGEQSALFNLTTSDLEENYFVTSSGTPLSDAIPAKVVAQGASVWLATQGDAGPSGSFIISKLDNAGNVLWESDVSHEAISPIFKALAPDANGNIVGLYQSNQTFTTGYYGVIKYDADGNEVFSHYVDDSQGYTVAGLATDDAGNIFVSGFDGDSGLMFLERYDPDGNLDWQVTHLSPSPTPYSIPFEMRYTAQGKLVIVASYREADNDSDLHLFQYTTDGSLEWHEDVVSAGGNFPYLSGLDIDGEGNIYVFGTSGLGYVAATFNSSGDAEWVHTGSTGVSQAPRSMTRDSDGNFFLAFSSGAGAIFMKLDSDGNLVDETTVTPTVNTYVFPRFGGFVNDQVVFLGSRFDSQYGEVGYQIVFDTNLELQEVTESPSETARMETATLSDDGHFYAAYLSGAVEIAKGARTSIVKRFSVEPLGLFDPPSSPGRMTVYPNPTSGEFQFMLTLDNPDRFEVLIRDIRGQVVHQLAAQPYTEPEQIQSIRIPSHLARGVYLVEVQTSDARLVAPVVLE